MQLTIDFSEFEPWGQAVSVWEYLSDVNAIDSLEYFLEEIYPDGMSSTELNDILAFEPEAVLPYIGVFGNLPTITKSDVDLELGDDPDDVYYGSVSVTTDLYADVELEFNATVDENGIVNNIDTDEDAMIHWGSYDEADDSDVFTSDIMGQLEEMYLGKK